MDRFTPEARIDEYLKKPIDLDAVRSGKPLSQEESKKMAREQVMRSRGVFVGTKWLSLLDAVKRNFYWRVKLIRLKWSRRFSYETLPLLIFSTFAVYVSWQMEDRLDQMKRKVVRSKTLREEEADRENKMITGALSGETEFKDKPISSQLDKNAKYRFEDDDAGDENGTTSIASPYTEYPHPDLTEDEMAKMMKQYEDRAALVMGGTMQMPNPGYSTDPSVNRRNIERYRPKKGDREDLV